MIILDTHIWIWWATDPDRLSSSQRKALDNDGEIAVSVISCWEVSVAASKKRVVFSEPVAEWMSGTMKSFKIEMLPLTPEICAGAYELSPDFHGDPADRMIVSTSLSHGAKLVTSDSRILAMPGLQTVA